MSERRSVLVFGGIIIDHYLIVDRYPTPGQDTVIQEEFDRVGGSAINVAFTLNNLNCTPLIVATVGMDERGQYIYDYLSEHAFATSCIKRDPRHKTGYCITVLDNEGERTFFTRKGCEDQFSAHMLDMVDEKIPFVYVTGYYLLSETYRPEIITALKKLKQSGSTILFDPGPLVHQIVREDLLTVLSLADIITPNVYEVNQLRMTLNITETFYTWCFNVGIETVLIKNGSQGAYMFRNDGRWHCQPYKVNTVDTSGAGDSFAAGFIAGLAHGYDCEMCLNIASASGSLATTFKGPHGKFGWNDVLHLIERGGRIS